MRRLSQIGIVATEEQGNRLHDKLEQGQRMVSANGASVALGRLHGRRGRTDRRRNPSCAAQPSRRDAGRCRKSGCRRSTLAQGEREKTAAAARDAADAERKAREGVWAADKAAQEIGSTATALAESTADARFASAD
jgi:hypothetical protein